MINLLLDELKLVAKNRNIMARNLIKIFSEPKPKISISEKYLKEIKKDFRELRHKFSKKEIDKFRKSFYNKKNHKNLYTSEIREAEKNLAELEESLLFKKFYGYHYNDENKKLNSIRRLFDVFKPPKKLIVVLVVKKNSYIEYISMNMKIYYQKNILI